MAMSGSSKNVYGAERGFFANASHTTQHTPNFSVFKGDFDAIRPTITPTDIDMLIEANGHLLISEYKDECVAVQLGQKITLDTLKKRDCTVIEAFHKGPLCQMQFVGFKVYVPAYLMNGGKPYKGQYQGHDALQMLKKTHKWWANKVKQTGKYKPRF